MIYLDNAATTKMDLECLEEYEKYSTNYFYNPSAIYSQAMLAESKLQETRLNIAKSLGCIPDEIFFTASGSESDNIALFNTIKQKKGKIIISAIEHAAVFNSAKRLQELGYEILIAPVDKNGRVIVSEFKKLLDNDVVLVSIMHVCNETGAINPIKELVDVTKKINNKIIFHSDGVQAFCKINFNLKNLGVDLYSISSHKINGPKGVGAIYIKKGINPRTFIYGGGQESNLRSATENVPGIAAFNKALNIKKNNFIDNYNMVLSLQSFAYNYIKDNIDDCIINTDINNSSPYILSFALKNIRGEGVVHYLESKDIIIGTGSACSAKKALKRVPEALNLPKEYHNGMLRISFDSNSTLEDLDIALHELSIAIKNERNLII